MLEYPLSECTESVEIVDSIPSRSRIIEAVCKPALRLRQLSQPLAVAAIASTTAVNFASISSAFVVGYPNSCAGISSSCRHFAGREELGRNA